MQQNLIEEESLKVLVKQSLTENRSIVCLSLWKNPGFSEKLRRQVALCLLRNIEACRQSGVELKDEWIKPENLTIKVPQRIMEQLGINAEQASTFQTQQDSRSPSQKRTKATDRSLTKSSSKPIQIKV